MRIITNTIENEKLVHHPLPALLSRANPCPSPHRQVFPSSSPSAGAGWVEACGFFLYYFLSSQKVTKKDLTKRTRSAFGSVRTAFCLYGMVCFTLRAPDQNDGKSRIEPSSRLSVSRFSLPVSRFSPSPRRQFFPSSGLPRSPSFERSGNEGVATTRLQRALKILIHPLILRSSIGYAWISQFRD